MPRKTRILVRKQPTQERAHKLVQSLLDATAHILVKHGYEGFTTNRVAEVAGVSVGSLYQYFPNKESLLAALVQRWCESVMSALSVSFLEVQGKTAPEAVETLVHAALQTSRVNVKLHRILLQHVPNIGASPGLLEFNRRMSEIVATWLEQHRAQLEIDNFHLAAEVVVMTLGSLSDYALLHRPELLESAAFEEHLCRLILGYLAPSQAGRSVVQRGRRSKAQA